MCVLCGINKMVCVCFCAVTVIEFDENLDDYTKEQASGCDIEYVCVLCVLVRE